MEGEKSLDDYKRILGDEFRGRYVKDSEPKELIFSKDGYDFLSADENWREIKTIKYIVPPAFLCASKNRIEKSEDEKLFYRRIYVFYNERIDHFQRLCQLYKEPFEFAQFEEVVGVKFYPDTAEADLFHTCTKGITLDILDRQETPKKILKEIMEKHAKAMADLHSKGIIYTDPVPTNFKYDLKAKIIFNPHNCIDFLTVEGRPRETYQDAAELGALLYSHAYLPEWRRFVQRYLEAQRGAGKVHEKKRSEDFLGCVASHIARAEEGGFELLAPELQRKNKVVIRKSRGKPYRVSITVSRR